MKSFLKFLSSLQLTIACLVVGMAIIFFGTLDQTRLGIHGAVEKYFYSFFVYWTPPNLDISIPYMPGGYTVGFILLANLIAGHFTRLKLTPKKSGIWLTHIGILLLIVGEFVSSFFRVESAMRIDEGQSSDYSENHRLVELVIMDRSDDEKDRVYAIPESLLKNRQTITHPELPFSISIEAYMPNSVLLQRQGQLPPDAQLANKGIGLNSYALSIPKTGKMDERNLPSVMITLFDREEVIGTWLSRLSVPSQAFEYDGRSYTLELRPERYYYPFEVKLIDFSHDRYLGTNIPMNFSSLVEVSNKDGSENREYLIYMNHPLRFADLTFYQASFANNDLTSILQVVKNPGSILPYLSCILVSIGLLVQFGISLFRFSSRRRKVA